MKSRFSLVILLGLFTIISCSKGESGQVPSGTSHIVEDKNDEDSFESINSISFLKLEADLEREVSLSLEDKIILEDLSKIKEKVSELNARYKADIRQLEIDIEEIESRKELQEANYALIKDTYDQALAQFIKEETRLKKQLKIVKGEMDLAIANITELQGKINQYEVQKQLIIEEINEARSWGSSAMLWVGYDSYRDELLIRLSDLNKKFKIKEVKQDHYKKSQALRRKEKVRKGIEQDLERLARPDENLLARERKKIEDLEMSSISKKKAIDELTISLNTQQEMLNEEIQQYNKEAFRLYELNEFFDNRKSFLANFIQNGSVRLSELLTLSLRRQYTYFKEKNPYSKISFLEFEAEVKAISKNLSGDLDQLMKEIKTEVSSVLSKDLKESQYSKTMIDTLFYGKYDSYSLTSTYLAMVYRLNPKAQNVVVIIDRNKPVPGFIQFKNGEKFLFGVSMQGKNKVIEYGKVQDVKGELLVLEGRQFLVSELMGLYLNNQQEVLSQMMSFSSSYFGLVPSNLEGRKYGVELKEDTDFSKPINYNFMFYSEE